MSVLVRGLQMPEDCFLCPCIEYERPVYVCWITGCQAHHNKRPIGCPLVEVPTPHGRLIDADALKADLKRQCNEIFKIDAVAPDDFWITRNQAYNERLWKTWCDSFYDYLDTRETIIPASKEET